MSLFPFSQGKRTRRELELLNRETRRMLWWTRFFHTLVMLFCLVVLGAILQEHFPQQTADLMDALLEKLRAGVSALPF